MLSQERFLKPALRLVNLVPSLSRKSVTSKEKLNKSVKRSPLNMISSSNCNLSPPVKKLLNGEILLKPSPNSGKTTSLLLQHSTNKPMQCGLVEHITEMHFRNSTMKLISKKLNSLVLGEVKTKCMKDLLD